MAVEIIMTISKDYSTSTSYTTTSEKITIPFPTSPLTFYF